jgi:uncharacterized protein
MMIAVNDLDSKLDSLRGILRDCSPVIVAYSGGVDSAVVLAVAVAELGEKALACIGVSPSYPEREMRDAIVLAESIGAKVRQIGTEEHLDPRYAANPADRCYFCKTHLHDRLLDIAKSEGFATVADGNNASDATDDRPGMRAAAEHGVRSPLREAGLTKADVRAVAKQLGLAVWDKPAMACLSSRVPTGIAITPGLLQQVEKAEDVLAELGFKQFRVRHHGQVARIELREEDLSRAVEFRKQIIEGVRAAGYRHVAIDLAGFRREE